MVNPSPKLERWFLSNETNESTRLKLAVYELVSEDLYPSPGQIKRKLGRQDKHNLSGRECKWRDEAFRRMGWIRSPEMESGPIWFPPSPFKLVRSGNEWKIERKEDHAGKE
jgi:hypothetical protein